MTTTINLFDSISLHHGDCLEVLPSIIPTDKINLVFADLPYGKTSNKWDSPIDLSLLWKLLPPGIGYIFTASNGFEFDLYNSNPKNYCYKWVWNKNNSAGFALAKKRPLNVTEDILVFGSPRYYPQMETRGKIRKKGGYGKSTNYGITPSESNNNEYYPKSLLHFSSASQTGKRHPTQKPLDLLCYLVKTYSSFGDTILDPVMGSGSMAEACFNLGRKFIGIEKDEDIFCEAVAYLSELKKNLLPNLSLFGE